jgi:uncharacterized OB-fold protein
VTPNKPIPPMNPWAEPFWAGTREGKLLIQKCADCGKHVFYPRLVCPSCFSERLDWIEASGRGTVYSHTLVQNNPPSAFIEDLPFTIAIVELEEGVRMMTNVVECDPESVYCDMPVEVTFERLTDEITLPKFKPLAKGGTARA